MFFQGDLQAGIITALQSSKLVACLVRDASQESEIWEKDYLQDERVTAGLRESAVVLRLEAGSQEANYLSVFCAINNVPTFVIIHNGQLHEVLSSGISREEFVERITKVLTKFHPEPLEDHHTRASNSSTHDTTSKSSQHATSSVQTSSQISTTASRNAPYTSAEPSDTPGEASGSKDQHNNHTQSLPTAAAPKRQKDTTESKAQDVKYAEEQRKRQAEAEQERKRVLMLVENDKLERKKRQQQQQWHQTSIENSPNAQPRKKPTIADNVPEKGTCALQVRLLDGSTIRSRFSVENTLRSHVRKWVDETRTDNDAPYSFKVILAPFPNRAISITEEEETLQSLDLIPSATLVLVAIQKFSDAYENSSSSIISRGLSAGYGLLTSSVGYIAGNVGNWIGGQQVSNNEDTSKQMSEDANAQRVDTGRMSHINIRTLREQGTSQEHPQLYNGNQLNFEPNEDEQRV